MFIAEKFNADDWADLYCRSGAKFAGPVAEHHDGFPMWNCSDTEWCASKMGPKRDIVGELEFDSVMIGHFHRVDEIDIGTGELLICGCMKGPDEFALQRLHAATKPKQVITYWHPKYANVGKEIIYLNRYDNSKRMFVDEIPATWADLIKPSLD